MGIATIVTQDMMHKCLNSNLTLLQVQFTHTLVKLPRKNKSLQWG